LFRALYESKIMGGGVVKPPRSIAERTTRGGWGSFCVWVFFGAAAAFGLLVFGFLAVLPILLGVWLGTTRSTLRQSWFGAMTGTGATSLYVAYVQRHGPGTVCWHTATAAGCDQYLNPWPWLVGGAALVVLGLVWQARRMRMRL
jgi:hypothetical protein